MGPQHRQQPEYRTRSAEFDSRRRPWTERPLPGLFAGWRIVKRDGPWRRRIDIGGRPRRALRPDRHFLQEPRRDEPEVWFRLLTLFAKCAAAFRVLRWAVYVLERSDKLDRNHRGYRWVAVRELHAWCGEWIGYTAQRADPVLLPLECLRWIRAERLEGAAQPDAESRCTVKRADAAHGEIRSSRLLPPGYDQHIPIGDPGAASGRHDTHEHLGTGVRVQRTRRQLALSDPY